MNASKGTIYIRDNPWYRMEHVVKLGVATFAKDRSHTYITGEVERGEYLCVIEIHLDKMKIIDKMLKQYYKPYHRYKGGGTEFYDRCIIDLIEPYLKKINFEYRVLSKEEINLMNRCDRIILKIKPLIPKIDTLIQKYKRKNIELINQADELLIKPNKHQQEVLENIEGFFTLHHIGKIVWACGLGKALLCILIVKLLNFKSVVIGVPSNNLQKQMKHEILKLFPSKKNILFVGGDGVNSTTDKRQIIQFLNNEDNSYPKFIITTYHSCYLLLDITFDFKIGDEAHHLVGIEQDKGFRSFHKIISSKTLFMTATEKTIVTRIHSEIYSMDDENVFGRYIDTKTVQWAIENKKITDYSILVLKNTEDEVDEIVRSLRLNIMNKEIFISCYMCLKSFETYNDLTHVLLYTNTTEDAELSKTYINEILSLNILSFSKENVYNNALHSNNRNDLDSEVNKFKNTQRGIISCVYIFGEGFDLPKLNGVCIVGNMQSETRIVQYLLRPNRLDVEQPNKKAYVIIPYIDVNDWDSEDKSFEKLRNIVSQMRNVDENIEHKIRLLDRDKKTKKNEKKYDKRRNYEDYIFEENSNELNKLKLRLRYSKALGSKFTEEQDEYNYVRSINSSLNITSKDEYFQQQNVHIHFIPTPEEYFIEKGVWNNWYDFMGVGTNEFIPSKQEWIHFCKNIKSLEDYYKSCEECDKLPKEPADFYKDFTNIPSELGFNRNRRR
jgi:superfamily II DNA or RNA helicase